ncbi:hypothetical protein C8R43DRAFT_446353 [Mycena crocata]|nr:hypothetical protein C8R43DRAFT_446353 [Mycena crocata]
MSVVTHRKLRCLPHLFTPSITDLPPTDHLPAADTNPRRTKGSPSARPPHPSQRGGDGPCTPVIPFATSCGRTIPQRKPDLRTAGRGERRRWLECTRGTQREPLQDSVGTAAFSGKRRKTEASAAVRSCGSRVEPGDVAAGFVGAGPWSPGMRRLSSLDSELESGRRAGLRWRGRVPSSRRRRSVPVQSPASIRLECRGRLEPRRRSGNPKLEVVPSCGRALRLGCGAAKSKPGTGSEVWRADGNEVFASRFAASKYHKHPYMITYSQKICEYIT